MSQYMNFQPKKAPVVKPWPLVERFKQESIHGLSAQKCDRCREVAVSRGSTVLGSEALGIKQKKRFPPSLGANYKF